MITFDCHVHMGILEPKFNDENKKLFAYIKYKKNTPRLHLPQCVKKSIAKAVIFSFPLMEYDFVKQNDYVLDAARKYPYFYIPFLIPESVKSLENKIDDFVGIKDHFYFDFHNQISRNEILDFAEKTNKIYLFHAHKDKWNERIVTICKNFPDLKVIIAHSARPGPYSSINIKDRIDEIYGLIPENLRSNFYFDTSTIRDSEAIEYLVKKVGNNQILFGSDFPYYMKEGEDTLNEEMNCVLLSKISDTEKENILSNNFRKLFQKDNIWIRKPTQTDVSDLLETVKNINEQEKKFLALKPKLTLVKGQIRKCSHVLIAESPKKEISGFIRWSDRKDNTIMIEEIYVKPEFRGVKDILICSEFDQKV